MGNEPNGDLMALCQRHHVEVHEYHRKVGGSLRDATLKMVALADAAKSEAKKPSRRAMRRTVAASGRTQPR